jgi:hypothetical protein
MIHEAQRFWKRKHSRLISLSWKEQTEHALRGDAFEDGESRTHVPLLESFLDKSRILWLIEKRNNEEERFIYASLGALLPLGHF